jgi:CHASE2 domain-containing sensor protein
MAAVAADGDSSRSLDPAITDRRLLITAGLVLTLALALLLIFRPDPVQRAELRLYDQMLAGRTSKQLSVPALVGIDEESLAAYGQWPWPRYRLAQLVDRLWRQGAEVVVLDFLMPEPDRSSPEVIRAERRRDGLEATGATAVDGKDSNSDRLAAALGRGKAVLAVHLDFSGREVLSARPAPAMPPGMVFSSGPGSMDAWPRPTGAIRSLPQLTAASGAEGFTNTLKDIDGTLRRTPLLLSRENETIPSLALAAMLVTSPDRRLGLIREGEDRFLQWDGRRIPLDEAGNMLIDFSAGQPPFPYHSARAVLSETLAKDSLRGRIVLVGSWATGLGDLHLAPGGRWMRGLEVHADVIANVMNGNFISRPRWAVGGELVAVVLLGLACTLLLSRSGFWLSLVVAIFGTVGCYWLGRYLLVSQGIALSPLLPMLTPIVLTSILGLLKYGIEASKVRQGIRDLVEAQDEIIVSMSVLSEARDRETGLHIVRTRRYVEILARQLARTPKYATLDDATIRLLAKSAPLHDVGKVGIPDDVLRKAGKLNADEYAVMQSHTLIGAAALRRIVDAGGHPEKSEFLRYARQMTESHHERWDGGGYPHGLRGEQIPLAGRLMALADVYDALVSARVYKKPLSHEEACEYIRQHSGTHFDPDVVAAFEARADEFAGIAREFREEMIGEMQPAIEASMPQPAPPEDRAP